jgi:hypothetical protein
MKKLTRCAILAILLLNAVSYAQIKKPSGKANADLYGFFSGYWEGKGEFANHRTISATMAFHFSLDSAWFVAKHVDRPPNTYRSRSMWGITDKAGKMFAYIFDNSGSFRQFESNGWLDNRIIWVYVGAISEKKAFQRFIYKRIDINTFQMTYEISADSISWREGDHITFTRKIYKTNSY